MHSLATEGKAIGLPKFFDKQFEFSSPHWRLSSLAGCQVSAGWHKVAGMTDKNMAGFLPANPKNTATFLDQTRYSLRRNAAE